MMESTQYPYNLPWSVILWRLICVAAVVCLALLDWIPLSITLGLSSFFLLLVLLLLIRRLILPRQIELSPNALVLPTGFLHIRTAIIPYEEIESLSESRWAFGIVLYIHTDRRRYEIPCGFPIEPEAYVAVRDHLDALKQVQEPNKAIGGDDNETI